MFTVDVEDWFDGIPVSRGTKASAERSLHRGMDALVDLGRDWVAVARP